MSIPIAQFSTSPSPPHRSFPPLVSIRLFSTSVSQFLYMGNYYFTLNKSSSFKMRSLSEILGYTVRCRPPLPPSNLPTLTLLFMEPCSFRCIWSHRPTDMGLKYSCPGGVIFEIRSGFGLATGRGPVSVFSVFKDKCGFFWNNVAFTCR